MGDRDRGLAPLNAKLAYGDLRNALIDDYAARGNKSLHTLASGEETIVGLRQLDEFCGYVADQPEKPGNPGLMVARLNTNLARAFAKKRTEEGAGAAMINRSLQCLLRMLHIAHEDGKIQTVPKIRLPKEPSSRKGFLERAKFEELLAALPSYLRPLIVFLYWCGVRKAEELSIEWGQVDLEARIITLHDFQTKKSEARVVPLPSAVEETLHSVELKNRQGIRRHEPAHGVGAGLRSRWFGHAHQGRRRRLHVAQI